MTGSFESQSWYRVAHLKPRLAERTEITRQIFRGEPWTVLRDPVTGKFHRINENAHAVVSLMDGTRTLGEIWDIVCSELGDSAPAQDELLMIVAQLNTIDLLHTDGLPDAAALAGRGATLRRRGLLSRFMNPLALRLPVFDPDAFLTELAPVARPLFTIWAGLFYLVLIAMGAVTAARHWSELTENFADRVLSAESLIILLLVYPLVKTLHEIGHGIAIKHWGGEVHEVGLMFLVFVPVPYVDASAASGMPSKWRRMLIGGIGILVELGLAAAAAIVWTELEQGLWSAVAFNVMLIGGVSTVFFNGNPLLRFDGYYVLSDLIEIPNLGTRSNRYLGYLIQKRLFGIRSARSPVRAPGEARWFFGYAIAAFLYRLFISFAIISLVATKFFVFGVLLAIWALMLMFLMPLWRHLKFLLSGDALRGRRARAIGVSSAAAALVVALLGFVPIPFRTVAEGVIHAPDHAAVYASEAGLVELRRIEGGRVVQRGEPVLELDDPFAEAELRASRAAAETFALRYRQALSANAFDARLWRAQAARAESEVAMLEDRIAGLTVLSPRDGVLVLPEAADLDRRFLFRGDVVGYVVDPDELVVRTAVSQDVADLIRRRTVAVEMRPADRPSRRVPGRIVHEVPMIGDAIASAALTTEGGGPFVPDPRGDGSPRVIEQVMHFDVAAETRVPSEALGMRVYVRFDHGAEPVAPRLWRRVRQVFLRRFGV